ncbi:MAG: hypothetical protein ACRDP4_13230, partial [Nocardioidaceae bacterium]
EHKPTHGHASAWSGMCAPGAGVRSVHVTKQLVTVDLEGFAPDAPGNASCDLSMTGWTMQRQQVGWTIRTAIGSRAPVKVTTGGDYRVMRPITAQRRYLAS